jgi:hypothetical protein
MFIYVFDVIWFSVELLLFKGKIDETNSTSWKTCTDKEPYLLIHPPPPHPISFNSLRIIQIYKTHVSSRLTIMWPRRLNLPTDIMVAVRCSLFRGVDFTRINSNDKLRIGTVECSTTGRGIGIAFYLQSHFINRLCLPPNLLFHLNQEFFI